MHGTGETEFLLDNRVENNLFQMYSFLTYLGAEIEDITCVGHSLGAHICGMITNHLTSKQHRIIGKPPSSSITGENIVAGREKKS